LEYRVYEGQPPETIVEQIRRLYEMIFQISSERMAQKMKQVNHLLAIVAFDEEKAVGLKIGYESDFEEFYSWIGGFDPAYRRRGIGSKLMTKQHEWLRKHGDKIVTTQTKNKWRAMLLLNLRHGFDTSERLRTKKGNRKSFCISDYKFYPVRGKASGASGFDHRRRSDGGFSFLKAHSFLNGPKSHEGFSFSSKRSPEPHSVISCRNVGAKGALVRWAHKGERPWRIRSRAHHKPLSPFMALLFGWNDQAKAIGTASQSRTFPSRHMRWPAMTSSFNL